MSVEDGPIANAVGVSLKCKPSFQLGDPKENGDEPKVASVRLPCPRSIFALQRCFAGSSHRTHQQKAQPDIPFTYCNSLDKHPSTQSIHVLRSPSHTLRPRYLLQRQLSAMIPHGRLDAQMCDEGEQALLPESSASMFSSRNVALGCHADHECRFNLWIRKQFA